MRKNILTKALCLILAMALCLTVISVPVMAEETDISAQKNKVYNLVSQDKYKTDNNGYQTAEEAAASTGKVVIGENLSASQLPFCDRNNYYFQNTTSDMLGATFIRVYRNHAAFTDIDSSTPVTKTVEGQEPVTADSFDSYSGKASYGFRTSQALEKSWYCGAFSAQNGEPGWIEFNVSKACTVVAQDVAGFGWPNLDKTLWTASTSKMYRGGQAYERHYNAGDLVQIPNYGIGGSLADDTRITYEYTDLEGNAKVYETTVGKNKFIWEEIAIAIKWDEPISYDVTLKSVTAGGKAADLSAMENNTINVGVPVGSENVAFEVVANSEYATVSGAPETVSIGDTVEIVVTAEGGNTETYYINVIEEFFDITVEATEEYKALFAEDKYSGDFVFKKAEAPTYNLSKAKIAYPDKDGIWKNRLYEVKIDGEVYITGAKYSEAIAIRDAEENKDKTVTFTASGYNYDDATVEIMASSSFNSDAHNFGPIGSAFRNADFQIMTSRSIAPGRIANHKAAFADPDAAVAWLKVDSNYLMKVKPNKKATIYVVMNQQGSKNHTQYIKDGWSLVDSSSYFVSDRVDSLPAEAIIDEMEHVKTGKAWYMVEPSYELTAAPYSFVKIQYDTGSGTLAAPYPYAWYKTVEADEELLIPTVGVCADESAQQPPKVFVIEGEHKEWTPLSKDATLSGISYSVDGVVDGDIALTDANEYTIDVASNATEVVIDATPADEGATVEITQADLSAEEKKSVIKVTAADTMFTKEYTVNINVLAVPFMNINCASDTGGVSINSVYRIHDAGTEIGSSTYTAETPEEGVAKAAEYQERIDNFNAVNGEGAAYGTNLWNGFPYANTLKTDNVVTGAKLDNPVYISSAIEKHPDFITEGDGWVLKSNKGDTPTADDTKSFGKNDEYLTFEVLKPGTMYVVVTNGWGYKGGEDNGYSFLGANYKLAGQNTYYKHFEAGKVTVPAQDTDKYTLDKRQANTIGFVFVFDDEASTDIKSISYKYNGITTTLDHIRSNTHLTPVEVTPEMPYTGEVEIFIDPVIEGTTVEAVGSMENGNGTVVATVKSKDGAQTKDFTFNFSYVISNDANLKYVKADGESVTFEAGRKATINVPYGAEVPEITYEVNNKKATAVMETVDNVTTITVTAEDGVTVKVYTITFNIETASSDATLKSLKYGENEVALEDGKYEYAVELPYGSEIPEVTYEVNNENATAQAQTENGVTTITVTAQDSTVKTYVLTITVKAPSTDANLKYVKANGEILEFTSLKAEVELPCGSEMPEITYEVNNEGATAVMETNGNVITITVTAEDGTTTKKYTVTVNIEAPKAKITVSTNGKEILATIGDAPQANLGDVNTATYESGTAIVLEAVANENQTFMYWKEANIDTTGGMIVSENPVYSFIAGSDKNLSAVFADDAVYTVAFRSNGKIIAYGTPEALDVVPVDPYWAGYVFSGWYVNGELTALKAGEKIGELLENTEYKAGFTKSEEVYIVEVLNGENADAQILYKQYNDKVELTALDVAEKEFVCWKRDGKVVSYSKAYSFYVSGDTKIIAEYSLEKPEAPAVVITLAEPVVVAGNKLAYYAERNVKAEYTVVESGILLDNVDNFNVYTAKIKAVAKSTANIGQYTVRKGNVEKGQMWYAKAYVIYKDANGNTDIAYSELIGPDTVE